MELIKEDRSISTNNAAKKLFTLSRNEVSVPGDIDEAKLPLIKRITIKNRRELNFFIKIPFIIQ